MRQKLISCTWVLKVQCPKVIMSVNKYLYLIMLISKVITEVIRNV